MGSKDYERNSETIIIPPAHVALRCDNRYQSMMGPKTIGKVVAFLKATGLGYRKILEEIEISETQLAETEERIGLAVFDTGTFE
jgi:hypothetical protein